MESNRLRSFARTNGKGFLAALLLIFGVAPVWAKSEYLVSFHTQYPAAAGSRIDTCNLCHRAIPQLNAYGSDYAGHDKSYTAIETLDSDDDGASNLAEITALTFPGDPNDTPAPVATPTPTLTPTPPAFTPSATVTATTGAVCTCDCSGDSVVTVNELVTTISVALGTAAVDVCLAADRDGNGAVTVDELLAGVTAALNGCG